MDVHIETLRPQRVCFIRHIGPYREVGATFGRLFAWASRRGLPLPPDTLPGPGTRMIRR